MYKIIFLILSIFIIKSPLFSENVQNMPWKDGVYSGELQYGVPNGKGRFLLDTRMEINGSFINGIATGYAEVKIDRGRVQYKGNLLNNRFDGEGEYVSNEIRYQGSFKNGKFHGYGVWHHSNGDHYEGYFVESYKEGYGEYRSHNGDVYTGYWERNLRMGLAK
jgi:hypothetical protein